MEKRVMIMRDHGLEGYVWHTNPISSMPSVEKDTSNDSRLIVKLVVYLSNPVSGY
jgi:hypothetical protein